MFNAAKILENYFVTKLNQLEQKLCITKDFLVSSLYVSSQHGHRNAFIR